MQQPAMADSLRRMSNSILSPRLSSLKPSESKTTTAFPRQSNSVLPPMMLTATSPMSTMRRGTMLVDQPIIEIGEEDRMKQKEAKKRYRSVREMQRKDSEKYDRFRQYKHMKEFDPSELKDNVTLAARMKLQI